MKLPKDALEQIIRMHRFVHDGWCECSRIGSPSMSSKEWATHVAEIILKREERLG